MRTAIIFNGNIRTWERCKSSFLDACGDMNADVFISVSNKQYEYAEYTKNLQNFHDDYILSESDITKMFDGLNVKKIVIQDSQEAIQIANDELPKIKLHFNTSRHGDGIHNSIYIQYRRLYYSLRDIEQYEKENNFQYDRIMKTRTEIIYNVDIFKRCLENLNLDELLIDAGSVPVNDVFFLANRENASKIINYMFEEFYDPQYPEQDISWPPHTMMKNVIEVNKMKVVADRIIKHIEREKLQQVY